MKHVTDIVIGHGIVEPAVEWISPTHVINAFRPRVVCYDGQPMPETFFGTELEGVVMRVVAGIDDTHITEILIWAALLNVSQRGAARYVDRGVCRPVGTGPIAIKECAFISEVADAGQPVFEELSLYHQVPVQELRHMVASRKGGPQLARNGEHCVP